MKPLPTCPFCNKGQGTEDDRRDVYHFNCEQCGRHSMTFDAIDVANRHFKLDRWRLAAVSREVSERDPGEFLIQKDDLAGLLSQSPSLFNVPGKARKLLAAVARRSTQPGSYVRLSYERDFPLAYAADDQELTYIFHYLKDSGWVTGDVLMSELHITLTPSGWEENRGKFQLDSNKAFVAMWFNGEVQAAYEEGIYAAISEDCGYRPVRIDTEHYNGDIVDQVLAEINESRFVVADLTGHRNGVYFEAGYAMGQGIPVIWTCRDDAGQGTHFDAEHFNQIRWSDPVDLRNKLQARIRATIGRGPLATTE